MFVTWIDSDGIEHELPAIVEACSACRGTGRLFLPEEGDSICLMCEGTGKMKIVDVAKLSLEAWERLQFEMSREESERHDWRDRR